MRCCEMAESWRWLLIGGCERAASCTVREASDVRTDVEGSAVGRKSWWW